MKKGGLNANVKQVCAERKQRQLVTQDDERQVNQGHDFIDFKVKIN